MPTQPATYKTQQRQASFALLLKNTHLSGLCALGGAKWMTN